VKLNEKPSFNYYRETPQYTVSQKMSHLCLAINLTHVNRFWYFWQKCYR